MLFAAVIVLVVSKKTRRKKTPFFFLTETHTIEKVPAVSSTTMQSLRTKYPPKRLVFSQDVLRRRVFMLLEIFNIFSTLKQFLEGHYMGRVGYISWTGLVKITEMTKFLILIWASFSVSFFSWTICLHLHNSSHC